MVIKIKNLTLYTILGIYESEQEKKREVIINITIKTNFDKARYTNSIDDTIDYSKIINNIKSLVENKKFGLIEKMAQEILDLITKNDKIEECQLEIDKPKIFTEVQSASVTLNYQK